MRWGYFCISRKTGRKDIQQSINAAGTTRGLISFMWFAVNCGMLVGMTIKECHDILYFHFFSNQLIAY